MTDLQAALNHLESQRNAALARAERHYDSERADINLHFAKAKQALEDDAARTLPTAPTVLHDESLQSDTFTINQPPVCVIGPLWRMR